MWIIHIHRAPHRSNALHERIQDGGLPSTIAI